MQAFQSFKPEQVDEYLAGFRRMVSEFGEQRSNLALTRAIDNSGDFLPTIGAIRRYVPSETAQRETCPKCVETQGFVFVDKYTVKLCKHE